MTTDARRVKEYEAVHMSYDSDTHEVIRSLLSYCAGMNVSFADIYRVVDTKLPQERASVRSILEAFPYFVKDREEADAEEAAWSFDPELHRLALVVWAEEAARQGLSVRPPVADSTAPPPAPAVPVEPPPSRSEDDSRIAEAPTKIPAPVIPILIPPTVFLSILEAVRRSEPLKPIWRVFAREAANCGWTAVEGDGFRLTAAGAELMENPSDERVVQLGHLLCSLPAVASLLAHLQTCRAVDRYDLKLLAPALPPEPLWTWLVWWLIQQDFASVEGGNLRLKGGVKLG